ncbi:MAG: hypothetical protein KDJ19_01615 [Hyphomicrobiaceae bacterium]|nr:hypothetical protein [Hyphomicrobiaceae bacterium]MCC0025331.1 hypothetical protein [Hyphomicrobiaceae bacterium]
MQLSIPHNSATPVSKLEAKRLFVPLFAAFIAAAFLWHPGLAVMISIMALINLIALGLSAAVTISVKAIAARGLVQILSPLHLAGLVWLAILLGETTANPALAVLFSFAGLTTLVVADLVFSAAAAFVMARLAGTHGDVLSALVLADKYGGLLGELR